MIPPVETRRVRDCIGESPCVYCNPNIHTKLFECTNKYTLEWDVTNGRLHSTDCVEHITNDEIHKLIDSGAV